MRPLFNCLHEIFCHPGIMCYVGILKLALVAFLLLTLLSRRYDLVAASWTHDEDPSKVLSKKDLPDVVLVRKVIYSIESSTITLWGEKRYYLICHIFVFPFSLSNILSPSRLLVLQNKGREKMVAEEPTVRRNSGTKHQRASRCRRRL